MRSSHVRRSTRALTLAKKNPAAPLWPLAVGGAATLASVPLTVGLLTPPLGIATALYGAYWLTSNAANFALGTVSTTSRAIGLYVNPIPFAAAGVGYFIARRYSPDTSIRVLGTVVGYGAGLIAYKPFYDAASDQADATWCADHSFLAQFAPSCNSAGVQAILPKDEQTRKFCEETYILPWLTPSCYGR